MVDPHSLAALGRERQQRFLEEAATDRRIRQAQPLRHKPVLRLPRIQWSVRLLPRLQVR